MGFTIFRQADVEWTPRDDGSGRTVAVLSESLAESRANLWRYPPGARGRRHLDGAQEEVFVVLDGALTVDLGEPPERHVVERQHLRLAERVRNGARGDALREPLRDRRLAHAGGADERRVVLRLAQQDVDDARDLVVAAAHRLQPVRPRLGREVAQHPRHLPLVRRDPVSEHQPP